jgi:hypothetical protein
VVLAAACASTGAPSRTAPVSTDAELRTSVPVTFRVRPLAGPGTKGPHEVAPGSDPALAEVARWLAEHPEATVRVECAINPLLVDASPHPSWGAKLAHLVARDLVARGVACGQLRAVGVLAGRDAPVEQVHFFVEGRGEPRPAGATEDPCTP